MPPSTKKKKSAIRRRKKRALANVQPSSPSYSQQQQQEDEEDDDFKTHDEKETTNGDINIETSTNQIHYDDQLVEKDKNSSFIGDNEPITKNSTKESKEEMAGDKGTGDSESGKVHTEFPKKSDKGGSSSSSDSSSDDESKIAKKIRSSKKKVFGVWKDGIAGISNAFAGILPSEDKVEKIVSSSEDPVEKIVSSSEDSVENIVSSVEEKVEVSGSILPASVPPGVDTSYDGGENSEVPETPESPEKQELLPIVPTTVQPASWRSCCGLFDVLTGSNR